MVANPFYIPPKKEPEPKKKSKSGKLLERIKNDVEKNSQRKLSQ